MDIATARALKRAEHQCDDDYWNLDSLFVPMEEEEAVLWDNGFLSGGTVCEWEIRSYAGLCNSVRPCNE